MSFYLYFLIQVTFFIIVINCFFQQEFAPFFVFGLSYQFLLSRFKVHILEKINSNSERFAFLKNLYRFQYLLEESLKKIQMGMVFQKVLGSLVPFYFIGILEFIFCDRLFYSIWTFYGVFVGLAFNIQMIEKKLILKKTFFKIFKN